MGKRPVILVGMAGGALWALALLLLAEPVLGTLPGMSALEAWSLAAVPGGLVLCAMIGRLAQRRFFDDAIIDGEPFSGAAAVDQKVLSNTVEQLVLAACLWPLAGEILGASVVVLLGVSFGITRVLFWIGYHQSPPLRGFGFAAGFYPTVFAAVYALVRWGLS